MYSQLISQNHSRPQCTQHNRPHVKPLDELLIFSHSTKLLVLRQKIPVLHGGLTVFSYNGKRLYRMVRDIGG